MSNITRRDFIKRAAVSAASVGLLGISAAVASEQGVAYTPGTYTSVQTTGYAWIIVSGTFSADALTAASYEVTESSANDYFPTFKGAAEYLCERIVEAQSTEIDGISGATLCTNALKRGVDTCKMQALGLITAEEANAPKDVYVSEIPNFLKSPVLIDDSKINATIEADVVVVGLGVAGVAAMRAAVEGGKKVVAIEKCSIVSGRSSQFSFFNCEKSREMGIPDIDANELVNEMMIQMGHRADARILKRWADTCGEAVTWYGEGYDGIVWVPVGQSPSSENISGCATNIYPEYEYGKDHERIFSGTCSFRPSGHLPVLEANCEKAIAAGAQVFFDSPARQLVKEDGRVVGVIFQSLVDESYTKVVAKDGVVLATGGFSRNDEMLDYYAPWIYQIKDKYRFTYSHQDINGEFANMGDGHRMGYWVGGQIEPGPLGTMAHGDFGRLGPDAFLQLNGQGDRYINEDLTNDHYGAQFIRQPSPIYMVFDSEWPNQLEYMQGGLGTLRSANQNLIESIETWTDAMGGTVKELIENLGVSEEAGARMQAAIERYNELCEKGVDEDFGKTPTRMFPIKNPPFYIIADYSSLRCLVTLGGLRTTPDAEVVDYNHNVIPGLYAIGNCQGGRFVSDYPTTIAGASHSMAVTYGYLTGKLLASL